MSKSGTEKQVGIVGAVKPETVSATSPVFSIRLSSAEDLATIQGRADAQGLSVPDFARSILLGGKLQRGRLKVAASVRDDVVRVLGRLGKLGGDISKLSEVARASGEIPQVEVLEASHRELMAVLEELRGALL